MPQKNRDILLKIQLALDTYIEKNPQAGKEAVQDFAAAWSGIASAFEADGEFGLLTAQAARTQAALAVFSGKLDSVSERLERLARAADSMVSYTGLYSSGAWLTGAQPVLLAPAEAGQHGTGSAAGAESTLRYTVSDMLFKTGGLSARTPDSGGAGGASSSKNGILSAMISSSTGEIAKTLNQKITTGLNQTIANDKVLGQAMGKALGVSATQASWAAVDAGGAAAAGAGALPALAVALIADKAIETVQEGVQTAIVWQSEMAGFQANTGASAGQMENINSAVRQTGRKTLYSFEEASAAAQALYEAGIALDDIDTMLQQVSVFAGAANLDISDSARFISNMLYAFDMDASKAGYMQDIMLAGAQQTNSSVEAYAAAMRGAMPYADQLGYRISDLSVAFGVLHEGGLRIEESALAMQALFADMLEPSAEAQKALEELGISFKDEVTGEFKSFHTVARQIRESFSGLSDDQKRAYAQTIAGTQGMEAFLAIAETTAEKYALISGATFGSEGTAREMEETRQQTAQGQLGLLDAEWSELKGSIGDAVLPFVQIAAGAGVSILSGINDLIAGHNRGNAAQEESKRLENRKQEELWLLYDDVTQNREQFSPEQLAQRYEQIRATAYELSTITGNPLYSEILAQEDLLTGEGKLKLDSAAVIARNTYENSREEAPSDIETRINNQLALAELWQIEADKLEEARDILARWEAIPNRTGFLESFPDVYQQIVQEKSGEEYTQALTELLKNYHAVSGENTAHLIEGLLSDDAALKMLAEDEISKLAERMAYSIPEIDETRMDTEWRKEVLALEQTVADHAEAWQYFYDEMGEYLGRGLISQVEFQEILRRALGEGTPGYIDNGESVQIGSAAWMSGERSRAELFEEKPQELSAGAAYSAQESDILTQFAAGAGIEQLFGAFGEASTGTALFDMNGILEQAFAEMDAETGEMVSHFGQELMHRLAEGMALENEQTSEEMRATLADMLRAALLPDGEEVPVFHEFSSYVLEEMEEMWNQLAESGRASVQSFLLALASAFEQHRYMLGEAQRNTLVGSLEAAAYEMHGRAAQIGRNTVQGVASGIDQSGYIAAAAAERLGERMLTALKSNLGIHSPSKRAKTEVGEMLGQGAAEGIDDGFAGQGKLRLREYDAPAVQGYVKAPEVTANAKDAGGYTPASIEIYSNVTISGASADDIDRRMQQYNADLVQKIDDYMSERARNERRRQYA